MYTPSSISRLATLARRRHCTWSDQYSILFQLFAAYEPIYNSQAETPVYKRCTSTVPVCSRFFDAPATNGAGVVARWQWRTAEHGRVSTQPWPVYFEQPACRFRFLADVPYTVAKCYAYNNRIELPWENILSPVHTSNNAGATFDFVERIVWLVAFDNVASTLLLVLTGL